MKKKEMSWSRLVNWSAQTFNNFFTSIICNTDKNEWIVAFYLFGPSIFANK